MRTTLPELEALLAQIRDWARLTDAQAQFIEDCVWYTLLDGSMACKPPFDPMLAHGMTNAHAHIAARIEATLNGGQL